MKLTYLLVTMSFLVCLVIISVTDSIMVFIPESYDYTLKIVVAIFFGVALGSLFAVILENIEV